MIKVATIGLTGCSGCHVAILALGEKIVEASEKLDIEHSYILVDSKNIPEDIDVVLVEGGVRSNRDVDVLKVARERSRLLVAIGSCSSFGGTPSLANTSRIQSLVETMYGGEFKPNQAMIPSLRDYVKPVGELVKVDLEVPGCPPEPRNLQELLENLLAGKSAEAPKYNVCKECVRKREKPTILVDYCIGCGNCEANCPEEAIKLKSTGQAEIDVEKCTGCSMCVIECPARAIVMPQMNVSSRIGIETIDSEKCLFEQGLPCMGPATLGGCGAPCPASSSTCDGCRGSYRRGVDQGLAMIDVRSSSLRLTIPEVGGKYDLQTLTSLYYRYALSRSVLQAILEASAK
jgi:F420-non-reducing hydrogenase small subunit